MTFFQNQYKGFKEVIKIDQKAWQATHITLKSTNICQVSSFLGTKRQEPNMDSNFP